MKHFPCFSSTCHFSCKHCRYFSVYLSFYSGLLLLWSNLTYGVSADDSSDGTGAGALQNSKYIIDYLLVLQRSQNEIFRKIDWLTKRMEEKDHEHYQFRLKFSRKVHTLENKVLYMEQTFTQKVEQVVQKKVDEMMASSDSSRLRYYHTISGSSSSSSSNSRDSHGSPTKGSTGDDDDVKDNDDDDGSSAPIMDIQSHQPMQPSYNYIHQSHRNNPYTRYQYNAAHQLQLPSYSTSTTSQRNSQNWGFYEHPITHKRVRDSQTHLFGVGGGGGLGGYEPPTRDLPRISLVATGATPLNYNNVVGDNQPEQHQSLRLTQNSSDAKGGSSQLSSSTPSLIANSTTNRVILGETTEGPVRERDGGRKSSKHCDDHKKKFESYDLALRSLRENVTSLEREIFKALSYQNRENDNSEMVRLLVDAKKEVTGIHQKHEEMVHRIEHFTVEMEKAAAKREHSVNESLKEISSELRKQITAVKAYAKKQIQNVTLQATSGTQHGVTRTPDKLQCAQFVLDELLAHLSKPKALQSQMMQPDHHRGLIADEAGGRSNEQRGNERESGSPYMSRRSVDRQSSDTLIKELETQRKDIMELKSEIGKLNISQILLMRTVDEETLKRTVRPRDCTEIRLLRNASSGVYSIFPQMNDVSTEVYCDMITDGGGWTVIQRRGVPIPEESKEIRESFARNWDEYEKGFGSLSGDFWLGLSKIILLCKLGIQELRIDLTNWSGETRFAHYQYFKILNATQLYTLNVKGYSGTAGDSLSRHSGMAFSTPDFDHDVDPRRHCAKTYFSGWWYYACFESNLNGLYIGDHENDEAAFGAGIIWHNWMGLNYSLKSAEMKIRNRFI